MSRAWVLGLALQRPLAARGGPCPQDTLFPWVPEAVSAVARCLRVAGLVVCVCVRLASPPVLWGLSASPALGTPVSGDSPVPALAGGRLLLWLLSLSLPRASPTVWRELSWLCREGLQRLAAPASGIPRACPLDHVALVSSWCLGRAGTLVPSAS